ncbi:hypothetical protein TRICI_000828 [Trichomonascus ciferrii]|uniref:Uncharacterized protein n=1 Tax=Trichomonascus ciferrii TaxID=44093 RepID=A0A642VA97_9ASCO|nr:hypothetical protein TRICI_000828 [Trichomonascus ciferrii]
MKKFPSFSFAPKENKGNETDKGDKSRRRRKDGKRGPIGGEADRIIREAKEAAEGNDLFVVDTEGDSGNLKYEVPYRYDVPKYERRRKVQTKGKERYKAEADAKEIDVREQTQLGDFSSFADVLGEEYEELPGKSDEDEEEEKIGIDFSEFRDIMSGSQKVEERVGKKRNRLKKLLELRSKVNEELRQSAHDVEKWYKLLDIELRVCSEEAGRNDLSLNPEIVSSVLDRALESNPGHVRLISDKLRNSQKMNVSSDWQEYALKYPETADFWINWISSGFKELPASGILEITELLESNYKLFSKLVEMVDQIQSEAIEKSYVKVVYHVTQLFRDTGYCERAIAIYQALIELSFYCPNEGLSRDQCLKAFEQYWERETRRFGDPGAKGWKNVTENELVPRLANMNSLTFDEELEPIDIAFPGRSIDDDSLKDLERVVLFEDIAPYLVKLTTTAGRSELLLAFTSILCPMHSTWPGADLGERLFSTETHNQQILEIIRQIVRTDKQLHPDFISWIFRFTSSVDLNFYKKVSKVLLSKDYCRNNILLYQLHGQLMNHYFNDPTTLEMVNQSITRSQDTISSKLWAWVSWAVDELSSSTPNLTELSSSIESNTLGGPLIITEKAAKSIVSLHESNGTGTMKRVSGTQSSRSEPGGLEAIPPEDELTLLTRFVYCYVNALKDETSLQEAVDRLVHEYWEFTTGDSACLIKVTDILMKHLWGQKHKGMKLIQQHFFKSFNALSDDTPNIELIRRLVDFQRSAHWTSLVDIVKASFDTVESRIAVLYYELQLDKQHILNAFKNAVERNKITGLEMTNATIWIKYLDAAAEKDSNPHRILLKGTESAVWNKQLIVHGLTTLKDKVSPMLTRQLFQRCFERQFRMYNDLEALTN